MKNYTEGHCANKRAKGGCQLHNLYCGYPKCDMKPIPKVPELSRCVCGGPEGDCGCALGYADAIAEQRKKESAPLLTAEIAQATLDHQAQDLSRWMRAMRAIASGRVVCIDTQTHVAVKKMTEAEAREKWRATEEPSRPSYMMEAIFYMDKFRQQREAGYLAALRDLGVIKS